MTKLIGALVILGAYVLAIYTTDIFVHQYDWTATLIPLIILLAYALIISAWGKRGLRKNAEFYEEQSNLRHGTVIEQEAELIELKDDYATELKKNENYEKMWAQIKKQEDATINLGDTATTLKYHKPRKVTAMKLELASGTTVTDTEFVYYKLGSKWYNRNEIKKVEAIK